MHISHSKTGSRRSHHRAQAPKLTATEGGVRRRHFVDPATGMYRGKQILSAPVKVKAVAAPAKKASGKAAPKKTAAATKAVEKKSK